MLFKCILFTTSPSIFKKCFWFSFVFLSMYSQLLVKNWTKFYKCWPFFFFFYLKLRVSIENDLNNHQITFVMILDFKSHFLHHLVIIFSIFLIAVKFFNLNVSFCECVCFPNVASVLLLSIWLFDVFLKCSLLNANVIFFNYKWFLL